MKQERAMKRSSWLVAGVMSLAVLLAAALRAEEPTKKVDVVKLPWQRSSWQCAETVPLHSPVPMPSCSQWISRWRVRVSF
jgi:hypothetical protein